MRTIAALCVSRRSVYHSIPGVEAFDEVRGAMTFQGDMPALGHPPCRAWSAHCSHQAKPKPGEKELGIWVAEQVIKCGGILEQPAHSRLWTAANLPAPGRVKADLFTVEVWQAWWGYPLRKATWLLFSGINPKDIHYPMRLHPEGGDRRGEQVMSKIQRSATTLEFAEWLVKHARLAKL